FIGYYRVTLYTGIPLLSITSYSYIKYFKLWNKMNKETKRKYVALNPCRKWKFLISAEITFLSSQWLTQSVSKNSSAYAPVSNRKCLNWLTFGGIGANVPCRVPYSYPPCPDLEQEILKGCLAGLRSGLCCRQSRSVMIERAPHCMPVLDCLIRRSGSPVATA